jgi:hypothetical protein
MCGQTAAMIEWRPMVRGPNWGLTFRGRLHLRRSKEEEDMLFDLTLSLQKTEGDQNIKTYI